MTKSNYKPTGYGRGRPRNGEFRPPNPNAVSQLKYQKKKKETDPTHKDALAIYQYLWSLDNKDKQNIIKRKAYQRRKGWEKFINS